MSCCGGDCGSLPSVFGSAGVTVDLGDEGD